MAMEDALQLSLPFCVLLIVVYFFPLSWFFGVKQVILGWVSRSPVVKTLLSMSAVLAIALVLKERIVGGMDQHLATLVWVHLALVFVVYREHSLVQGAGLSRLVEMERRGEKEDMVNRVPRFDWWLVTLGLALPRWITPPVMKGLENIPKDNTKLFFVSNHAIWALDTPLFMYMLYHNAKVYVRGVADHFWYCIPFLGELVLALGAVDGTRENCDALMEAGEPVLVFPGGIREAFKLRNDPKYALFWDRSLGFARMAIKHGYTIIPVSTVGTEEMWRSSFDLPLGWLIRAFGKGMGGKSLETPLCLPPMPWDLQRIYFNFGKPITTTEFKGDYENVENQVKLRDLVKERLEVQIQEALKEQEADPHRYVFPTLRKLRKQKSVE